LLSSSFKVIFYSKESVVDCNLFVSAEYNSQRLGLGYDEAICLCVLLSVYTVFDFLYNKCIPCNKGCFVSHWSTKLYVWEILLLYSK